MNKIEEARALLKVLTDEVEELAARDDLDADGEARFELLVTTEVDEARSRVETLEAREKKITEIREAAVRSGATETGSGANGGPTLLRKSDPYDLTEVRAVGPNGGIPVDEYRTRAYDAIEQAPKFVTDEQRSAAAEKMDGDDTGLVAQWYLAHGSDDYRAAYDAYLRTGEKPSETRALTTTGQNGGFLIPFYLDPTVINTNAGAVNPFRAIARVETITSNVWHGLTSAGVQVEWTGELSEWTDASPTFAQPTVPTFKADAWVPASYEVIKSAPNLAEQLTGMFADAKNNEEAVVFTSGNGTTRPKGIVTALAAVTASRVAATTNGQFGINDLYSLVNGLPARHQANPAWLAHWATLNMVRNFSTAAAGTFWADLGVGTPPSLLGAPAYKASSMTSSLSGATASNDNLLILGDFNKYLIVDVIGMETIYVPVVMGPNQRPIGAAGWGCYWEVGADALDPNAFRMLVV